MELGELLKLYGPMAIGWIAAAYLLKFVLGRYDADIESRVKLAGALDNLARIIDKQGGAG